MHRRTKLIVGTVLLGLILLAFYIPWVHPFLAVTQRVEANILVVEGWVPANVLEGAAREFRKGGYLLIATSGERTPEEESESSAHRAGSRLIDVGLPEANVVPCPFEPVSWNRTGTSARAVRDRLIELGVEISGVNTVTAGPHARQTHLAYRRIFSEVCPVGVISIEKLYYDQDRWWASWPGIKWTNKDFLAWIKEATFGYRS